MLVKLSHKHVVQCKIRIMFTSWFYFFSNLLTVLTSVQRVKKILGVVKLHLAAHVMDLYVRMNKIY